MDLLHHHKAGTAEINFAIAHSSKFSSPYQKRVRKPLVQNLC